MITNEEAIEMLKSKMDGQTDTSYEWAETVRMSIKSLEQETCEDAISRKALIERINHAEENFKADNMESIASDNADPFIDGVLSGVFCIREMAIQAPPVTPQPKIEHCKDCKYFEYDSFAKVDGIPLIVAHEICSKWGDGCKTKENGYCFLFEPQ